MERNRVVKSREVKSYKWSDLKDNPPVNSVLYVLDKDTGGIEVFVTDKNGVPKPLKTTEVNISDYVDGRIGNAIIVEEGKLYSKKPVSGDEYVIVSENPSNFKITINEGKIEFKKNKQNSLQHDGTGVKYPTVDAVNKKIKEIENRLDANYSDKNFVHEQTSPSSIWEFRHNLNKKPSVTITDSAGTVIEGSVVINDGVSVKIEFNSSFWGFAICN